jgi:homoserine dehydrogenase
MIDFAYAHDLYLRSTVRQIARAELRVGKLYASVEPAILRRDSPLAQLEGGQNLVVSTGVYGGETVFSGHGAGGNPTAVAVVSDLLAVSRNRSQGLENLSGGATSAYPVSHDFVTLIMFALRFATVRESSPLWLSHFPIMELILKPCCKDPIARKRRCRS